VVSKPHTQFQQGETQLTRDSCMRCRDTAVRTTGGKPLGQRRPMRRSRPKGWSACMAHEEGEVLPGRMTRSLGARVGTQAVILARVALRRGNLTHWEGPKTGNSAAKERPQNTRVLGWHVDRNTRKVYKAYGKQNKVRFHTLTHKLTQFWENSVTHFSEH